MKRQTLNITNQELAADIIDLSFYRTYKVVMLL